MEGLSKSVVQIDPSELDGVKPEDRTLVSDVIAVLSALPSKLIKGYVVCPKGSSYEVQGFIDTKDGNWEVSSEDMDLLRRVDDYRIRPPSVRITKQSACIVVGVLSRSEPLAVCEHDIVRVKKRTRFWWGP